MSIKALQHYGKLNFVYFSVIASKFAEFISAYHNVHCLKCHICYKPTGDFLE